MKRNELLKHLRRHGCHLKREGASHSLWINPQTGETQAVPRHTEIPNKLEAKRIGPFLLIFPPPLFHHDRRDYVVEVGEFLLQELVSLGLYFVLVRALAVGRTVSVA
jgi:mRNA interferase HicA